MTLHVIGRAGGSSPAAPGGVRCASPATWTALTLTALRALAPRYSLPPSLPEGEGIWEVLPGGEGTGGARVPALRDWGAGAGPALRTKTRVKPYPPVPADNERAGHGGYCVVPLARKLLRLSRHAIPWHVGEGDTRWV